MEKLDLTKLPIGTKLWSPLLGDCTLTEIRIITAMGESNYYPIHLENNKGQSIFLTKEGMYYVDVEGTECLVFLSKENQSWEGYFNTLLTDKALVWCWMNEWKFQRILKFYDAENRCTFYPHDGKRNGLEYDNYEPYEGEYPEWAKEAQKKLKD